MRLLWHPQQSWLCFFGFFVQLFWPFYRLVWLFRRLVHALMLSRSSWTATKTFFWHKIVFRKKYWNLNLAWETHTDPRKTLADHRMIAIIDNEELDWKEEGILNTAKYTNKHIVGSLCQLCLVWMGGGRQRFDPNHRRQWDNSQVNHEILNITDKDELHCWLSKFVIKV